MGEVVRMTNSSTGGPVFVYVKDGKIIRMTPMDLDDAVDAPPWKIEARGRTFTPPRKTSVSVAPSRVRQLVVPSKRSEPSIVVAHQWPAGAWSWTRWPPMD